MFPSWLFVVAIALVFAVTVAVFFLSYRVGSDGLATYRERFSSNLGSTLKKSFIQWDTDALLYGSAALTLALGAFGYWVFSGPGAVLGVAAGIAAPWVAVWYVTKKRIKQFVFQLPDALQALASALRSGTTLSRAMEQVANRQSPPLSQEFSLVLAEYRVGRDFNEALLDIHRRIPRQEVALMTTAITVSRRVGGDLAQTLETLSKTLYEKAQIEEKIDSLTAMGRAQGWVVGMLPVFIGYVLYLEQPDKMHMLISTWIGWGVLAVIILMELVALFIIWKIVNIDV